MAEKEVMTIRLEPKWRDKVNETAKRMDISASEVIRRRVRFGLNKYEYRNLEDLAKEQEIGESEVVAQGLKSMSALVDPDLKFIDVMKAIPEIEKNMLNDNKD